MSYDAIIIGAGVVGCSIALALTRQGFKTLSVDSNPAAGYGSTSHSSAIIRPFYSHITSAAIAHESRCHWRNWPSFLDIPASEPLAQYSETGGLVLVREGHQSQYADNVAVLKHLGIQHQILTPTEIEHLYPDISMKAYGPPKSLGDPTFGQPSAGEISSGIYINACGYVSDPQLAANNLYQAAKQLGAAFEFNTLVTQINRLGGAITGVKLKGSRQLSCPVLVNAAGPHSSVVNRMADVNLAINTHAHRHEVAYAKMPGDFSGRAGFLVDIDSGFYARPDGADLLIGSTDPTCDEPDIVDPDDFSNAFTDQWTTQVYRAAQRWPHLGIENTARGTVGLYDVSDDWIPVYDKTDLDGYFVAIGTSGNQFKNAPLVGDIMAAVITTPDHDVHPASLTLAHVGVSVDLSFYSRNRDIKKTSSVLA